MKSAAEAQIILALYIMFFLAFAPLFGFILAKILIKIKKTLRYGNKDECSS